MALLHCSPSQAALRIISLLPLSSGLLTHFSLHQFPGKKFALVQQTRAALWPQIQPPSLPPGQCFLCQKSSSSRSFPKQISLQSRKLRGSPPILFSARFGERDACTTAPGIFTAVPSMQHPVFPSQRPARVRQPCSSRAAAMQQFCSISAALCPGCQPAQRVPASTALQVALALPAGFWQGGSLADATGLYPFISPH